MSPRGAAPPRPTGPQPRVARPNTRQAQPPQTAQRGPTQHAQPPRRSFSSDDLDQMPIEVWDLQEGDDLAQPTPSQIHPNPPRHYRSPDGGRSGGMYSPGSITNLPQFSNSQLPAAYSPSVQVDAYPPAQTPYQSMSGSYPAPNFGQTQPPRQVPPQQNYQPSPYNQNSLYNQPSPYNQPPQNYPPQQNYQPSPYDQPHEYNPPPEPLHPPHSSPYSQRSPSSDRYPAQHWTPPEESLGESLSFADLPMAEDDLSPDHVGMQEQELGGFEDFLSANTAPPQEPFSSDVPIPPLKSTEQISDLLGEPMHFEDRLSGDADENDEFFQDALSTPLASSSATPISLDAAVPALPSLSDDLRSAIRKTIDPAMYESRPANASNAPPGLPDPSFHIAEAPPSHPRQATPRQAPPVQSSAPQPSAPAPITPAYPIEELPSGGLRYSKGKNIQSGPPSFKQPPQALTPPPAKKEKSNKAKMQELLKDFVQSEEDAGALQRFLIRRGEKQFGPFTEEEIFDLLNKHDLDGNEELAPIQGESSEVFWQPLYTWPSFAPFVEWLDQNPLRVAMPGVRARGETNTTGEVDPIAASWGKTEDAEPRQGLRGIHPAFWGLAALLFVGSIVTTFWLFRSASFRRNQRNKIPLTISQRAIQLDDIKAHRELAGQALLAYQKQKTPLAWLDIRYAYLLFDSYGVERSLRADVEVVWRDLKKQKLPPEKADDFVLVDLSRAIGLRSNTDLQRLYPKLRTGLKKRVKSVEWGYPIARMFELMGRQRPALELYRFLCEKQTRSALPCWRLGLYYLQKKKNAQALAFLLQAQSRSPEHFPTLLKLLEIGWKHDSPPWRKRIMKIRRVLQQKTLQLRYPPELMARYYALEARYLWSEDQADEALRSLEKATSLQPDDTSILQTLLQYAFWAGQPTRALETIQKTYAEELPDKPELTLLYFRILRHLDARKTWRSASRNLQKRGFKTPQDRYLTLFVQAQWFEMQGKQPLALQAYRQALQERWRPATPFAYLALLPLLVQQQEPDKAEQEKYLKDFERDFPNRPEPLYWQAKLLDHKEQHARYLQISQQLQAKYPRTPYGYELAAYDSKRSPKERFAFLKQAYTLRDGRTRLLLSVIQQLLQQGKTKKALPYLKIALQARPANERCQILEMTALALTALDQCDALPEADKQCTGAPLAYPKGLCLLRRGKADEAQPLFARAERFEKDKTTARFAQALAATQQESAKAQRLLRRILQKEHNFFPAWVLWMTSAEDKKTRDTLMRFHRSQIAKWTDAPEWLKDLPEVLEILFSESKKTLRKLKKKYGKTAASPKPVTPKPVAKKGKKKKPSKIPKPTKRPKPAKPLKVAATPRLTLFFQALLATRLGDDPNQTQMKKLHEAHPRWALPSLALSEMARRKKHVPNCRAPLVEQRQANHPLPMRLLFAHLYARCQQDQTIE